MNLFALMSAADQHARVSQLAASGLRENMIATLTGWSVTDVRRALATANDPPLAAVNSAAFFQPSKVNANDR